MSASLERLLVLGIGAAAGALLVVVATRRADDAPTGLVPTADPVSLVHPNRRATSQRVVKQLNADRWRCSTCGLESTKGPLSRHQTAQNHHGMERV